MRDLCPSRPAKCVGFCRRETSPPSSGFINAKVTESVEVAEGKIEHVCVVQVSEGSPLMVDPQPASRSRCSPQDAAGPEQGGSCKEPKDAAVGHRRSRF